MNFWKDLVLQESKAGVLITNNINLDFYFVIGGSVDGSIVAEVSCLNLDTLDSVELPSMIISREDLAADIGTILPYLDKKGRLYAVGGFGGYLKTCLSSIERFDPSTNAWTMLTEMSTTRRGPGCAIIK